MTNRKKTAICILLLAAVLLLQIALEWIGPILMPEFTAEQLGIVTVTAKTDFDGDGIDDYTDIMQGARIDVRNHPTYDGRYWGNGGYPPENIGVCTDLVWRAFRNAGYDLRTMVNNDIRDNLSSYPRVGTTRDTNIDFRRVPNLRVFFERYAENLTTDIMRTEEWQPGDIVTFGDYHIGIVSDKRDKRGIPLLLHNGGQLDREDDGLYAGNISGHFRFDASLLEESMLIAWSE